MALNQQIIIYIFSYESYQLGTTFIVHKGTISVVKRVGVLSNCMSRIILAFWYDAVLNDHAPTEDGSCDADSSIFEELLFSTSLPMEL
jgi:hypothetical protein